MERTLEDDLRQAWTRVHAGVRTLLEYHQTAAVLRLADAFDDAMDAHGSETRHLGEL